MRQSSPDINERAGLAGCLERVEDKLDFLISDVRAVHVRLNAHEREISELKKSTHRTSSHSLENEGAIGRLMGEVSALAKAQTENTRLTLATNLETEAQTPLLAKISRDQWKAIAVALLWVVGEIALRLAPYIQGH